MADDWTDNLPKLLPSWQGCIPKYLSTLKKTKLKDPLPDYGGVGVDVSSDEHTFKCEISKHGVDQVHFGAQTCALAFFTNGKAHQIQDPCLQNVSSKIKNYEKFSSKLHFARQVLNYKNRSTFRKDILTTHMKIKSMCLSGHFRKLSLAQNIVDMANIIPATPQFPDKINLNYSGGCLTTLNQSKHNPVLLHPVGLKLNKLAATQLLYANESYQAFQHEELKTTTVKLKGGIIQQIKSNFDGLCYVKLEKQCHLVDFASSPVVHKIPCPKWETLRIISPSPYVPTELVSIYENGRVLLSDINQSEIIWEKNPRCFETSIASEKPMDCHFGSHPRSLLYLDAKEVYTLDLRCMENISTSILSCYHPVCLANESFLCMKKSAVNSFQQFVFSDHHLFLCDERYSAKPVLIWNHLLDGSPLYCDITTYDTTEDSSDAVILVATQDTQELTSFAVRSRQSQLQTISLTPPLALSTVTDWADSLQLHGNYIADHVTKRTSNPVVGVCAVAHCEEPAFTAFQVTSVGDVFYQDFKKVPDPEVERTYKNSSGCVLAAPSKILPQMSKWMTEFDEKSEGNSSSCSLNHVNIDLKECLKSPDEVSDWCLLCRSYVPNSDDKIVSNFICPSCGLNKFLSENLNKEYKEMGLLINPAVENPDGPNFDNIEELLKFTDSYSKKMLDIWIPETNVSQDHELPTFQCKLEPDSVLISAANTSYTALSSQSIDFGKSSQLDDSKQLMEPSSQSLFGDGPEIQDSMFTQSFISPSQNNLPKNGKTKKTAKKLTAFRQLNSPNAGF